jgi:hypothetical protein
MGIIEVHPPSTSRDIFVPEGHVFVCGTLYDLADVMSGATQQGRDVVFCGETGSNTPPKYAAYICKSQSSACSTPPHPLDPNREYAT